MAISKINTRALSNDSVTADKVADNAITTDMISSGEIGVTDLADGAITNAKVSSTAAIDASKLNLSAVTSAGITTLTGQDINLYNATDGNNALRFYDDDDLLSGSLYVWNSRLNIASYNSQDIALAPAGNVNLTSGNFEVGGTTVIDSSRNVSGTRGTFTVDDNAEYSDTEDSELNPVGSDALYLHNAESTSTNGKVSLLMRSTGGGGGAAGRITLENSRSGAGAFNFFLRDNGHTSSQQAKLTLNSDGDLDLLQGQLFVGGTTVINSSQVGFLNEKTRIGTGATYPTDNAQLYIQRSNNNPYIGFFSNDGSRNAYLQSVAGGNMIFGNEESGGWEFNNGTSGVAVISNNGALTATGAAISGAVELGSAVQGNEPSQQGTLRFRQAGGASSAGGVEFHTSSGGGAGYGARVTADANGYMFLQTRSNASSWTTGLTVLNNKLNFDNAEGQSPSWDFSGGNYNEAGYSTNYNVKCIKLGRLVLQQGGSSAEIKLLCGAGYNAVSTQNRTFKLNLRTSNGATTTVTNLGGTSSYVRINGYGYVESRDPAAADNTTVDEWYITEVNSTTWDVYIKTQGLIGVYNTYSVLCTSSSASWSHSPSVVDISSLGSNTFAINANERQLMLTGQSAHATASFGEGTGVTAGNKIPMTYIRAYKNLTVDQTNERFTVLYPGAYAIQYSFLGETSGTQARIVVNGTTVAGSYTQCGSGNLTMSTTITQNLSQGDYVEFFCHSGTIHENANYTSMSMWLIG